MKKLLLSFSFLFLFASISYAQDTVYLDKKWNETLVQQEAAYYQTLDRNESNPDKVLARTFFLSGQLYQEIPYSSYEEKSREGIAAFWYESGNKKMEIHYENGEKHGSFITYWENGTTKRREIWKNGKWKSGQTWNADGEEVEYYDFEIRPQFPGGKNGLLKYLKVNMKFPPEARKLKIDGKIIVKFTVEPSGEVANINVGPGNIYLKMEAYRLVNEMPRWTPGYQDGNAVRVHYALPLNFRL